MIKCNNRSKICKQCSRKPTIEWIVDKRSNIVEKLFITTVECIHFKNVSGMLRFERPREGQRNQKCLQWNKSSAHILNLRRRQLQLDNNAHTATFRRPQSQPVLQNVGHYLQARHVNDQSPSCWFWLIRLAHL